MFGCGHLRRRLIRDGGKGVEFGLSRGLPPDQKRRWENLQRPAGRALSRNTIKKWLRGSEAPHQQRRNRDSKLTPFEPLLKLALETDAHRPQAGSSYGRAAV